MGPGVGDGWVREAGASPASRTHPSPVIPDSSPSNPLKVHLTPTLGPIFFFTEQYWKAPKTVTCDPRFIPQTGRILLSKISLGR